MLARFLGVTAVFFSTAQLLAQVPFNAAAPPVAPSAAPTVGPVNGWRPPAVTTTPGGAVATASAPNVTQPPLVPIGSAPRQPIAKVTKGPGTLPNDGNQEWRDYDITPYTARVTSTTRPEQAIVDWILRETGYEAWHSEPLGLLSANKRLLRVYHTPEMQAVVADMVDRFVNSEAESQAFGLRVVTVDSPNWRTKAVRMIRPVAVQSQGVQAWLMAKEDAALLIADLRRRSDYREHSSPHLLVNNGQSTIVSAMRPRNYVRDVILRGDAWPGFEQQTAQLDEGFSIEFSPLLSLDSKTIDAIVKCNVDQIEKMIPVTLDVPTAVAPRQRTKIEVPQITSCRLHERFRWPTDQVLLISLGVVAAPAPTSTTNPLAALSLVDAPSRSDLLMFVESRGKIGTPPTALGPTGREASLYRGRY